MKHNLQYIHFDAGWYGYEHLKESDASRVDVDPRRNPKKDLDLKEVIRYAKKRNIGVILYVNQRALAHQLDEILPLYRDWGVSGIKFGFVQVGSHRWTTWLHEAIRKCAEYQLVVDIHDEYRPTGFSRTYPNLMTQEGIRGNEEMPDAIHNTILPFTRYIAGAADYTICYYRQDFTDKSQHNSYTAPGRVIKTTSAHQLALAAIYYSPLQYLYWYDKPEDSQEEPELAFFDAIPTVWDDTKVLDGSPGEFVSIARKSGDDWFLGCITNNNSRTVTILPSFLEKGSKYKAIIYEDGDKNIKTRTQVKITEKRVDGLQQLNFNLKNSGGVAIHFIKER
ncbi:MAG: glycoside hydrolase family 97 catalytic domain-containing protein [Bacteroides sp.]|nr:glycoside hydrolase family 97 catalytic domain-containing protein [Bacteroides sp.]